MIIDTTQTKIERELGWYAEMVLVASLDSDLKMTNLRHVSPEEILAKHLTAGESGE